MATRERIPGGIETVLDSLGHYEETAENRYIARCPAHDDNNPSLSIEVAASGTVLLYCHAGCELNEILEAMELTTAHLKPEPKEVATYDYTDETGNLLYQVVRFEPKSFRQRRPTQDGGWEYNLDGTRRVPYRLPEVLRQVEQGKPVYVVEGEKDVESIRRMGAVATCNSGGAGGWRSEYSEYLAGAQVEIIADNDEAGKEHARLVEEDLKRVGCVVRVRVPKDAKDVSDLKELAPEFFAELGDEDLPPVVGELIGSELTYLEAKGRGDIEPGLSTGYEPVDKLLGGLEKGRLYIIGGRPAMGKSAFALNITENVVAQGHTAAFFSLEMASRELITRTLARWGDVSGSVIQKRGITADMSDKVHQAAAKLETMPLYLDDRGAINTDQIAQTTRALKARKDLKLVVIDYLQLLQTTNPKASKEGQVGEMSQALKTLARELDIPVVVVAQLNRAVEYRESKRPMLSDLRDSGRIEQDADVIVFLYREDYYDQDSSIPGMCDIIVAKNRQGETATTSLKFQADRPQFV